MQKEDFADLYALEEKFWWFAGMREITASVLDGFCAGGEKTASGNFDNSLRQIVETHRIVMSDVINFAVGIFARARESNFLWDFFTRVI